MFNENRPVQGECGQYNLEVYVFFWRVRMCVWRMLVFAILSMPEKGLKF